MDGSLQLRQLYRELADGYAERGQPQFRDRFLVLAAAAALAEGDSDAAERYRQRLLNVNPHHLLKPYSSFAQAMQMDDVQIYVRDLQQNYPPEISDGLLRSMQQPREPEARQIPVTAPLLNLDSGPDLLMDDEGEPLQILSFVEDSKSGVPPTLPPNKFPAPPAKEPARSSIPPTLYDAEVPVALPPAPAPRLPRIGQPILQQRPPLRNTPPPRTAKAPPLPILPPSPAPDWETETAGAWLATFLFGVVAAAGFALLCYALIYPLIANR
jgi:hypothetical protein